jgi:hypothetical protein
VFTFPGEEQLKIRHDPAIGICLLVISGGFFLYGLLQSLLDEYDPIVVTALLPMLVGMLYLGRPYFRVTPTSVDIVRLIGPAPLRQFPYETLKVEAGNLVAVQANGISTKVRVSRRFAHPGDWRKLIGSLQA